MALTQDEINQITQMVNQAMTSNNQNLLNQVQNLVQQTPTTAPPPAPAPAYPTTPAYPAAPPRYPQSQVVQQYDPMELAQNVAEILARQQYQTGYGNVGFMNQYGQLTLHDLMNQPAPVRDAWLQVVSQPSMDPTYQALNQKIDDLTDQLQWQQWHDSKRHSKRHTAMKVGAVAIGVGGAAYAVHKFKHRHDKDKSIDALTNLGNRYIDAKYGSDV